MGGRGNESFLACTGVYLVHFPCKELLLSIASLPAISFSSSLATLNQIPCKKKKKERFHVVWSSILALSPAEWLSWGNRFMEQESN
jgi:hypothetical protein